MFSAAVIKLNTGHECLGMGYKMVLDRVESLDGENSDLYLETVEQDLRGRHRSAGEKIKEVEQDGFHTISIVKRRIAYRAFLESAKESDDTEEFTERIERFYMRVRSVDRDGSDELREILSEILRSPLKEVK